MGAKWDSKRKKREESRKLKRKSLCSPFLKKGKEKESIEKVSFLLDFSTFS